jgi:hypothetical protein
MVSKPSAKGAPGSASFEHTKTRCACDLLRDADDHRARAPRIEDRA